MIEQFRLSESDTRSEVWLRLKSHMEDRLQTLRAQNDGDLDEVKTAKLRGRINELKYLLALDQPLEPVPAQVTSDG